MNIRRRRRSIDRRLYGHLVDQMRPSAWAATYEVGEGKTYATINAALAAAKTARTEANGREPAPWWRAKVLIYPGTYPEIVDFSALATQRSFIDLVGATGNADDVVIQHACAPDSSLLWKIETCTLYVAHLTLKLLDDDGYADPWHYRGAVKLNTASARQTFICENVTFVVEDSAAPEDGPTHWCPAYSIYPGDRSVYVTYNCRFISNADHGWQQTWSIETNQSNVQRHQPAHVLALDCVATADLTKTYNLAGNSALAVTDTNHPAYPNDPSIADVVAWIGGRVDTGAALEVQAIIASGYNDHWGTMTYMDPASVSSFRYGAPSDVGMLSRTVYDPSAVWPVDGLSPVSRAFYYPNRIGTSEALTPLTGEAAPATLTANRLYYVPVLIPSSHLIASIGATVVAGSANKLWCSYYGDGPVLHYIPELGGAPGAVMNKTWLAGIAASTGTKAYSLWSLQNKAVFPGLRVIWAALVTNDDAVEFTCATTISGDYPVYYQDLVDPSVHPSSATPLELPADTPFPVLSLNCS